VQQWTESTDPVKFVFEDINIASFLVGLWETLGCEKESIRFADLGCGNGLLTNILVSEGFKGFGIDLRKRKVWEQYDKKVQDCLVEGEVKLDFPCQGYADINWIIGNHTDEITPWIPFITSKCSKGARFVTIPCCLWDLRGKFTFSAKPNEGRYKVYCDYVKQVSEGCGYLVKEEWLRIPSTRNLALVGIPHGEISEATRKKMLSHLDRLGLYEAFAH